MRVGAGSLLVRGAADVFGRSVDVVKQGTKFGFKRTIIVGAAQSAGGAEFGERNLADRADARGRRSRCCDAFALFRGHGVARFADVVLSMSPAEVGFAEFSIVGDVGDVKKRLFVTLLALHRV